MKPLKIIFIILNLVFYSCGNSEKNKTETTMAKNNLLEHVKLAINPKFQDWVLFKNGTYIIFDNADGIPNLEDEALRLMKEFGPAYAGSPSGDFSVTHLNQTEGWVVSAHGYGIYTYVNPTELKTPNPNDMEIGLFGRSKRELDGNDLNVIHINRKPR